MSFRFLMRVFAVLIIVLVASPVTAPFSSCDLSVTTNLLHAEDLISSSKLSPDTLILTPGLVGGSSGTVLAAAVVVAASPVLDEHDGRCLVLRL